jgi:hypothetical protein
MIIKNQTSSDLPFLDGKINPNFFGTTSQTTGTVTETVLVQPPPYEKTIVVTPPAYTSDVYVQPPAIVQTVDGTSVTVNLPPIKQTITVTPPPVTQEITITPPAYTTTVTKSGKTEVVNKFAAVGVVQTWPYRLCALVKSNVIVGAKHYSIPVGSKVRFYSATGYEELTVKSIAKSYYDLELYYLDRNATAVPTPVYDNQNWSLYPRQKIVTFGLIGDRSPPYGNWIPAALGGSILGFAGIPLPDRAISARLDDLQNGVQNGDSGAPNFILDGGQYKFLGSIWRTGGSYLINAAAPRASEINSL